MDFRLPIPAIKSEFSISHSDKLLILGSCFTENIGQLLGNAGFQTVINPFGIIYNPISIFRNLSILHQHKKYAERDLSRRGEFFFSFDHHGSFSDIDKAQCLQNINSQIEKATPFFKESTILLVTLGTAFVYEHIEAGRIVSNCHKIPAAAFKKRLLTKEEIVNEFAAVKDLVPLSAKIIFTLSPVRHWKDGAVENAHSKAIVLTAIHEIIRNSKNCFYFPAYELMMDDLRDYRFYANDMLHPNALAIEYIWERFKETYFSAETEQVTGELENLRLAMEHRPLFVNSEAYKKFEAGLEAKKESFRKKYPFIHL